MTEAPDNITAAATLLRNEGWTVVAPSAPQSDAIPEPEVGQVWVSPRTKPQTVMHVDGIGVNYYDGACVTLSEWRAWAKRTGARPQ